MGDVVMKIDGRPVQKRARHRVVNCRQPDGNGKRELYDKRRVDGGARGQSALIQSFLSY
jgi:hypothetical protein